MDKTIIDYYEKKLLQIPKRERQSDGSIKEVYNQPERLNPEDEREKRELEFFIKNLGFLNEDLKNFKDPHSLTFVCDSLNTTNK